MKKSRAKTVRKGGHVKPLAKRGRDDKKNPRTHHQDKSTIQGSFASKAKVRRQSWRMKYFRLVEDFNICPISTESQHREALANIDSLMTPHPDRAESYAIDLLAKYIVDYESRTHPTPDVPPGRMLAHMIEAKELTQAEVAESTGIPASTISAVIAGRRKLSTDAIGRLCEYFDVSADVFIQRHAIAT